MSPNTQPPQPETPVEPTSADDYVRRGWVYHVKAEHARAEADFRQAIALNAQSIEAYYALGLSLKIQRQPQPAAQAFERVVALVKDGVMSNDPSRATMLRHLSRWHLLTIQAGLDKEPNP